MNQTKIHSNQDIANLSVNCLRRYFHEFGMKKPDEMIINLQDIYESAIYPEYELSIRTDIDLGDHDNQKVLGKTISDEKIILIDTSIAPETHDPRLSGLANPSGSDIKKR